jgi:hypothetical protein
MPKKGTRRDRRRSQAEAVQARPASAVADQVGLGGGAEFSSENLLELREVRREVAAVHAQAQRTLGFVEVLHRPGDPAQFDEVAQLPVGVGEFLGRCRQRRFAAQRTRRAKTLSRASSAGGSANALPAARTRRASRSICSSAGASAWRAASTVSL